MLMIAVVIPNYNQSHFLPYALESIRHQSTPVNLAVMDGGSNDQFDEAVRPYQDMITYLRSSPDDGQASAIREGKSAIKGDIVCWLNADDYYFPNALDRVAAEFKNNPEVDVVYGDAVHVTPEGAFLSYFPGIQAHDAKALFTSCYICQPACFVKRAAYEAAGGIDPALQYTMDWDLWCRLARNGARFKYIRQALAAVRYYPETKTLSGDLRRYREIWRIGLLYGRRFLPVALPGFYHFDLAFKSEKTKRESLLFNLLDRTCQLKKRLIKRSTDTLYGFYRNERSVEGPGWIQIPLYGEQKHLGMTLRVSPENSIYRIHLNSHDSRNVPAKNGYIEIDADKEGKNSLSLRVECISQRKWELLDFSFSNRQS